MTSAHLRNDAKTAWMVATFGDFEIGKMARRESKSGRRIVRNVAGPNIDLQHGRGSRDPGRRMANFRCALNIFLRLNSGDWLSLFQLGKVRNDFPLCASRAILRLPQ